ncbi:carboxypeptidase-like regulatory domain-containing protein [Paraflavitalea pollutisoli]|uniref:carboxypeptidase-like regulatory domain-containing protein n=1 Tax=Paraflavitalea pollutisoli TaxID=3034143 RepID=UPI0023EB1C3C|nr:carboxypeptidase-like regulatory domain-containing protein [Paraflavitalea sp. H1-2-19X]
MLRKYTRLLLLTAWIIPAAWSVTADRTISGTIVTADDNTPVEGVQVAVKGTNRTSGTQADGVFYIPVKEKDSVLTFTHSDYEQQDVKLTSSNDYTITMRHKKQ